MRAPECAECTVMSADLHADVACAGPLDTDGEAPVAPRFSDVDWLRPRDMKDDNKVPLGERAHLFIDDAEQLPLSPVAPDDGVVVEQLDELAGACPTDVVPSTVLDDLDEMGRRLSAAVAPPQAEAGGDRGALGIRI